MGMTVNKKRGGISGNALRLWGMIFVILPLASVSASMMSQWWIRFGLNERKPTRTAQFN